MDAIHALVIYTLTVYGAAQLESYLNVLSHSSVHKQEMFSIVDQNKSFYGSQ
jgi:hypothetical protein